MISAHSYNDGGYIFPFALHQIDDHKTNDLIEDLHKYTVAPQWEWNNPKVQDTNPRLSGKVCLQYLEDNHKPITKRHPWNTRLYTNAWTNIKSSTDFGKLVASRRASGMHGTGKDYTRILN